MIYLNSEKLKVITITRIERSVNFESIKNKESFWCESIMENVSNNTFYKSM